VKRRGVLAAGAAWLASAATGVFGQAAGTLRRIVFVHPGTQAGYQSLFGAFRAELKERGHIEQRSITIDVLFAEGKTDRLSALAAQAVALKPTVIVTGTSAGIAACMKATSSVPIVFATGFNPVQQGFVSSLRRPGGNVTGVIVYSDLAAKVVEITREIFPQMARLALLIHDVDPAHKIVLENFVPSAQRFHFKPQIVRVARAEDLDRAFKEISDQAADALYVPELAFTTSYSYGTGREENFRRAGALVDKILRGAKPGELPVEQPERFLLVVNRKTAKAIGATLSPVTMLRADRFID
jgi:putative tryptophan/tyrosine transport system substrate-binding protein